MKDFWQKLARPITVLAPMEAVTDTVFRRIVAGYAKPSVFYTEFVNVDGMFSEGRSFVEHRLKYTREERPLIAQIWGVKPELFLSAAKRVKALGFDGIDINMGCPDSGITQKGACSALIGNPTLAGEIIKAVKEGAGDLPVSVKTRIGRSSIQTEEWCSFLLDQNIDALVVHGRTVREMSKVPAHWDEIGKVVKLRNDMKIPTVIIGNGDIKSLENGKAMIERYGVDGFMVGRGIFDDLFFFDENKHMAELQKDEKMRLLLSHMNLFIETWGETKNFAILKKFFKIYANGFDGAGKLRMKLMDTTTPNEVEQIVSTFLHNS